MASLTLKKIPEDVMERLRSLAEKERRSLNQQAILLLEQALEERRPGFMEAYEGFLREHGPSPFDDESFEEVFGGLRDQGTGRPSPFEDSKGEENRR